MPRKLYSVYFLSWLHCAVLQWSFTHSSMGPSVLWASPELVGDCVLTHTRASCCPWMVWVHEACSLLGTKSQTHCWIQGQGRSLKTDMSIYQTKATSSKTVPVANTLISKTAIPHEAQGAPLTYGPGRISPQWAGSKSKGTVTNSELIVKIWNPPLGLHNLVCVPQVQVPVLSVYGMGSSQGLTCVAWIPAPEINVGSLGSR